MKNQAYIVGDNVTLLYSDNPLTSAFALASSNRRLLGAGLEPACFQK